MSSERSLAPPRLPSSGRLEAFTDGVLAIAITLLVLDLRVPEVKGGFAHELADAWQSYVAYLAAFLIIGTLWLTHHTLFGRIARVDGPVLGANLAVLLLASALPFPTAVISSAFRVGDRADQTVSLVLYAVISIGLSILWYGLTAHLVRSPHLLHDANDATQIERERRRQLVAVLPPVVGIALAFVLPIAALLLQAATPLFYLTTVAS